MEPTDDIEGTTGGPEERSPEEQLRSRIRLAREEDAQTQRSIVQFIVSVTVGFIVSTAVMGLGMSMDQMWLFYTGMGMAVVCTGAILLRL